MGKRKLEKVIDGTVLKIKEVETGEERTYDFSKLPKDIQAKLGPYGMSQKIGDAAAGRSGNEALENMDRVYKGLEEGNWTVRLPAAEKYTKSSLKKKVEGLTGANKAAVLDALKKLGIEI